MTIHGKVQALLRERLTTAILVEEAKLIESHLPVCAACSLVDEELNSKIRQVRRELGTVVASAPLVRHTKSGVRRAAMQMQKRQERMSPLWIASAIACLWALLSIPLIWEGTQWIGGHTSVPMYVWQTAAVFVWLMPTGIAVALGVWSRDMRAVEE